MVKIKEKRMPSEWELKFGVRILDPDGWRYPHGRLRPKLYHIKISQREFYLRSFHSIKELRNK